eukprot:2066816-Amphidinium_carterae.1
MELQPSENTHKRTDKDMAHISSHVRTEITHTTGTHRATRNIIITLVVWQPPDQPKNIKQSTTQQKQRFPEPKATHNKYIHPTAKTIVKPPPLDHQDLNLQNQLYSNGDNNSDNNNKCQQQQQQAEMQTIDEEEQDDDQQDR